MLFRDKIRITFNFSPDKGKSDDNIDVDAAEIQEAQKEYNGCVIADKKQKNNPSQKACSGSDYSLLAESKGFEPLTQLPVYRISSAGRYDHFDNFPKK